MLADASASACYVMRNKRGCFMTPTILFYNLSNSKGKQIKLLCMRLKIRIKPVDPAEYTLPVGALLGFDDITLTETGTRETDFTDEMLVFSGFTGAMLDQFLTEYKKMHIPKTNLKAVITEHNISWSSIALHDELQREHEAMS